MSLQEPDQYRISSQQHRAAISIVAGFFNNLDNYLKEFLSIINPLISKWIYRRCRSLDIQVKIGSNNDIPFICFNSIPDKDGHQKCEAVCDQHINMIIMSYKVLEVYCSHLKNILNEPQLLQFIKRIADQFLVHTMGNKIIMKNMALPSSILEGLFSRPPFGNGGSFTLSGLPGYQYETTDEEILKGDTQKAENIFHKCVKMSKSEMNLHHFHLSVGAGKYIFDKRFAPDIPEVVNWVQQLNKRLPSLLFFLDPDCFSWVYACLNPTDKTSDNRINVSVATYISMLTQATLNASFELSGMGDNIENVLNQFAVNKAYSFGLNFESVHDRIKAKFKHCIDKVAPKEAMICAIIDASFTKTGRALEIELNMLSGYNDGRSHNFYTFDPQFLLLFVCSTFPTSLEDAKNVFNDYYPKSGYNSLIKELPEKLFLGNSLIKELNAFHLVHLIICHTSFHGISMYLSSFDLRKNEPFFISPDLI